MKFFSITFLVLIIYNISYSQVDSMDFSKPDAFKLNSETPQEIDDYKKIIIKANQLYKDKKYAESVVWYRKALELKPEEKLPKFRIEDVFTLFISNKIVINKGEALKLIEEVEFSMDQNAFEEMLSQRITEMKIKLKSEKKELSVDEIIALNKGESSKKAVDEKKEEFKPVNEVVLVEQIEKKHSEERKFAKANEFTELKPSIEVKNENIVVENKVVTEIKEEKKEQKIEIEDDRQKLEQKKEVKSNSVAKKLNPTPIELIPNAEAELDILREKYPNIRTEELIEEATKKTLKITYNQNGNITIYSKVTHNWGGVFYFMQVPPLPIQNISEEYFIRNSKK
jgi:hypothetical protein